MTSGATTASGDIPPTPAAGGGTGDLGKQYLKEYVAKTDPLFEEFLQKKIVEATSISHIPAELLKRFLETARRGKKIRGALVVLGYESCGGTDRDAILNASLSIELLHAGLLVHDDVMDEDKLRRGLPSLHEQLATVGTTWKVKSRKHHYGEAMAVIAGDIAFYLSWESLLTSRFPKNRLIDAGLVYTKLVTHTAYGQAMDLTNTPLTALNEDHILAVLRNKTAEYTGIMPLLLGAHLAASNTPAKLEAIEKYGLAFGWAFQIQDDVLGIFGDEEEFGKPVGSDIREGKNTLLMLHLHQHGTDEQRAFQKRILGNPDITKADVEKMREILKAAGSYQYVVNLGWKYVEKGKNVIPQITKNDELRTILESLITYMMERIA